MNAGKGMAPTSEPQQIGGKLDTRNSAPAANSLVRVEFIKDDDSKPPSRAQSAGGIRVILTAKRTPFIAASSSSI